MKRKLALSLIALALTGCTAIGPDYERPLTQLPDNWKTLPGVRADLWKPATPNDAMPKGDWWKAFNDPLLNDLEEKALAQNQTLKVALARLDQSMAQVDAKTAALYPSLALGAQAARIAYSADRSTSSYDSVQYSTIQNNFQPALTLSYQIDWLGQIRRNVEAAKYTSEQAIADTANVKLLVTAQLASAYLLMRQNDEELRVMGILLDLQKKLAALYQKRYEAGALNRSDLAIQESLVESSGAQIDILRGTRNIQVDLIATLIGVPASSLTIPQGHLPDTMPKFPAGIPSKLLERRPDIASAERAMAAANAQIGVAQAAFYPSLTLSPTNYGYQSTALSNLLSVPSLIWSIGLSATQTIFDGGAILANYNFSKAGYQATLGTYRQTILTGIQETQDAMGTLQQLDAARVKQDAAVDKLNKAYKIGSIRYQEGLDNAFQLALIQQNQLAALRTKWQIHGGQFVANVNLVKALGGGWEGFKTPAPPKPFTEEQTFGKPEAGQ